MLSSLLAMSREKIKSLAEIILVRERLRRDGKSLVFTNGCFDILHVGHVRYLCEARAMGEFLLVAVNSDRSVIEVKGPARPVVPEDERAEILAALSSVDYVTIFDEPTPRQIIDAVVPDVLVKGSDWSPDEIVGRETVEQAGGIVKTVTITQGVSTTGIISKIRSH